jgi:hypothetical protein
MPPNLGALFVSLLGRLLRTPHLFWQAPEPPVEMDAGCNSRIARAQALSCLLRPLQ